MLHKDACSAWNAGTYFLCIIMVINLVVGLYGLGKGILLIIMLKSAKKKLNNAAGTSVIFACGSVVFVVIWVAGYFQSLGVRDLHYQGKYGFALGVGGAVWFGTTAMLNLGLM